MEGKRSSEQEESLKCNIYRIKCQQSIHLLFSRIENVSSIEKRHVFTTETEEAKLLFQRLSDLSPGAQRVPFQVLGAVQTIILRRPQLCSTGLGSKNKVDLESKTLYSSNKSCLYLFKRNHIFRLPLRLNLGRLSLYAQINCQELPATVCGHWCELDIDASLRPLTNLLAVPAFSLAKQLITQKQAHVPSYPYLCIPTLTSSVFLDQLLLAVLHTHAGRGGVCPPWPAVSLEHQKTCISVSLGAVPALWVDLLYICQHPSLLSVAR